MLRCDEVSSVDLLTLSTSLTLCKPRKPPKSHEFVDASVQLQSETAGTAGRACVAGDHIDAAPEVSDASTQTEESLNQITEEVAELKLKVATLTKEFGEERRTVKKPKVVVIAYNGQ